MRTCGDCSLCCSTTWVPELRKLAGEPCHHAKDGCSIYKKRPTSCRNFSCEWLDGAMDEFMKPSKTGFLIERLTPTLVLLTEFPERSNYDIPQEVTDQLYTHFVNKGVSVVTIKLQALLAPGVDEREVRIQLSEAIKRFRGVSVAFR